MFLYFTKKNENYLYENQDVNINFAKANVTQKLSNNIIKCIEEIEKKIGLPLQFVTTENVGSIKILKDNSYILCLVPYDIEINEIHVAHELMHYILYAEGFNYLDVNLEDYAVNFINNIVLDIIVNNRLFVLYQDEIKREKRNIMSHNLDIVMNYDNYFLFNNMGQNEVLLRMIQIYVHNQLFNFERYNKLLHNQIAKKYPFVQLIGDRIINIINKEEINKDNYKKIIEEMLNLEIFEQNLKVTWLNI